MRAAEWAGGGGGPGAGPEDKGNHPAVASPEGGLQIESGGLWGPRVPSSGGTWEHFPCVARQVCA